MRDIFQYCLIIVIALIISITVWNWWDNRDNSDCLCKENEGFCNCSNYDNMSKNCPKNDKTKEYNRGATEYILF